MALEPFPKRPNVAAPPRRPAAAPSTPKKDVQPASQKGPESAEPTSQKGPEKGKIVQPLQEGSSHAPDYKM